MGAWSNLILCNSVPQLEIWNWYFSSYISIIADLAARYWFSTPPELRLKVMLLLSVLVLFSSDYLLVQIYPISKSCEQDMAMLPSLDSSHIKCILPATMRTIWCCSKWQLMSCRVHTPPRSLASWICPFLMSITWFFFQPAYQFNYQYTSLMVGLHAGNLWPRSLPWRQVLLTITFRIVVFGGVCGWLVGGSWKTNPPVWSGDYLHQYGSCSRDVCTGSGHTQCN